MHSADSSVSSAAEIPQSATTELITIRSEDRQEPRPEILVESMSGWQAGRAEEDAGEEVKKKSSFTRFRRKTQHLKEQSSNGWFPPHGGRRGLKQPSSREGGADLTFPLSDPSIQFERPSCFFMLNIILWLKPTRQNRPCTPVAVAIHFVPSFLCPWERYTNVPLSLYIRIVIDASCCQPPGVAGYGGLTLVFLRRLSL